MKLQTLDGLVLYLMLAVGLVFALVGLFLIVWRRPDENAARIELFGLKFQSSSVGTLVFLIGAAFLLVPLIAPKADRNTATPVPPPVSAPREDTTQTGAGEGGAKAVVLPARAGVSEIEENDHISNSNQFALGFGAKGTLDRDRDDFADWYLVDTSNSGTTDLTAQIRNLGGGCRLIVYDQHEEEIDSIYCNSNGGSRNLDFFSKDNDVIYLLVVFNGGSSASRSAYEVFLREK